MRLMIIDATLECSLVKVNGYSSKVKRHSVGQEHNVSGVPWGGAWGSGQRADGSLETTGGAGVVGLGCA